MKVEIGPSKLSDVINQALPLMREHFKEIHFLSDFEFNPDVNYYYALEASNNLKLFTVFVDDTLVGYSIYFVRQHPHSKQVFMAWQDAIYLAPEFRGNGMGKELVETADMFLSEIGCNVVFNFVSSKLDFGPLLQSVGYELIDKMYARRL